MRILIKMKYCKGSNILVFALSNLSIAIVAVLSGNLSVDIIPVNLCLVQKNDNRKYDSIYVKLPVKCNFASFKFFL